MAPGRRKKDYREEDREGCPLDSLLFVQACMDEGYSYHWASEEFGVPHTTTIITY